MTNLSTHIFYSPNKIILGMEAASNVSDELSKLGGGRVLLVTDPGVVQAGLISQIENFLKSNPPEQRLGPSPATRERPLVWRVHRKRWMRIPSQL